MIFWVVWCWKKLNHVRLVDRGDHLWSCMFWGLCVDNIIYIYFVPLLCYTSLFGYFEFVFCPYNFYFLFLCLEPDTCISACLPDDVCTHFSFYHPQCCFVLKQLMEFRIWFFPKSPSESLLPLFGLSKLSVVLFLPVSLSRRAVKQWEQWESSLLFKNRAVSKGNVKNPPLPVCFLKYLLKWTWELFPVGHNRGVFIYNYFYSILSCSTAANEHLLWAASAAFSSSHPSQYVESKGSLTPGHSRVRNTDILRSGSHFSSKIIW